MATTDPGLVAHLYRRAGFGASAPTIARASKRPWNDLVDELVAGLHGPDRRGDRVARPSLTSIPQSQAPGDDYNGWQEYVDLVDWWMQRMVVTDTPLREKLVLLLHNQFPTSWWKVGWASLMHTQNQIFRTLGPGNFRALTQAVAEDPAMLLWLDTTSSHRRAPNQNFARELMERFTMGVGTYSQGDVIEASRCFTGWELDWTTGNFYFNRWDHDGGVKHFVGHTGRFGGADVIRIATSTPASHRWVVSRLWSWLGYPASPRDSVVGDLARGYARDLDVGRLLSAILRHPAFRWRITVNALVKQPVEWVVGTLRNLGLSTASLGSGALPWYLGQLGQLPFGPPSVGGWGQNGYWLTTTSSNAYLQLASYLAYLADLGPVEAHNGNPSAQVAAVSELLGIQRWSAHTAAALARLATDLRGDGGTWPAQQLVTLALVSPDYMTN